MLMLKPSAVTAVRQPEQIKPAEKKSQNVVIAAEQIAEKMIIVDAVVWLAQLHSQSKLTLNSD